MTEHIPPPEVTELNAPHWTGLAEGRLRFQRCGACGNAWLPAREACPRCLADGATWEDASGRAKLVSWVVYHQSFHPAFAGRLPYTVAVVELDEGPRLYTNIVGVGDPEALRIDQPLDVVFEVDDDITLARFKPAV